MLMQEFYVALDGWNGFLSRWNAALQAIPGLKEASLEKAGDRLREELRGAIDRSGLNDPKGRVKLWQNRHVGSGKGYVAVRSDSVLVTAGANGRQVLNTGALTNFLTNGHKVRTPSGRSKRYISKANVSRARAFGFYADTGQTAQRIAAQAGEEFVKKVLVLIP